MVGAPSVLPVIGADLFRTGSCPDLVLPLLVKLLVTRLNLEVKQLGPEDGHCKILVLELGALLLAKDPNPGRDVEEIDG